MNTFLPIASLRFPENGFKTDTAGSGLITYEGVTDDESRRVVFNSPAPSGSRAMLRYRLAVEAGASIRVTAPFMRATHGSLWLGVDRKTGSGALSVSDAVEILSSEYGTYSVQVSTDALGFGEVVEIWIGARTNAPGIGDLIGPLLIEQAGGVVIRRQVAMGLITIVGGGGTGDFTVSMASNFSSFGVKSLTRIDPYNFDVELFTPYDEILTPVYDDVNWLRPYATLNADGANLKYIFGGHNWMDSDVYPKRNSFRVRAMNTETQVLENFDALSGPIYVHMSCFV